MSITNIDEFNRKGCNKIDANCINAYVDFHKNKENPTGICLETSWGSECLDLLDIIKAGETVTTLKLEPEDDPTCLVFHREDGQADCIHGDDLSRIISLIKLKDIDQSKAPENGDVYMYRDGKFYTFNLQQFVDNTNILIGNINATLEQIRNQIRPIVNRFREFEGVPDDAKIVLGNINLYSDVNANINSDGTIASLDKTSGLYGHNLNEDRTEDEIFG